MKAVSSQDYSGSTMKDFWGWEEGRKGVGETQAAQAAAEMVQGRDKVGLDQKDVLEVRKRWSSLHSTEKGEMTKANALWIDLITSHHHFLTHLE